MDVIKKKMNALKEKLDLAEKQAVEAEEELRETIEYAEEKEEEAIQLMDIKSHLEDDLDREEDRDNDLKRRYDEALKLSDENERAHNELCNRGETDTIRLDRLQAEIDDCCCKNEELEMQNQVIQQELEEAEQLLEEKEELLSLTDLRVKELEVEAVQTGNLLRSTEINEHLASKSECESDKKVHEMRLKLEEMIRDAEEKERLSAELEQRQEDLDAELHHANCKCQDMKSDYDALLAEVAEM